MRLALFGLLTAVFVSVAGCDNAAPVTSSTPEPQTKTEEAIMKNGNKISVTTMVMPGQETPPGKKK